MRLYSTLKHKLSSAAAIGTIVLGAGLIGTGLSSCLQHFDTPGFDDKTPDGGRLRNATAVLVAGSVASQLYDNATIDIEIEKFAWPNSMIKGDVTPTSIKARTDVLLSSADYQATRQDSNSFFEGHIAKSEFNWNVKQTDENTWDVGRFIYKFDNQLVLHTDNGKIFGTYVRAGPQWDFDISGTYDANGNTKIHVNIPWGYDIDLVGTITSSL